MKKENENRRMEKGRGKKRRQKRRESQMSRWRSLTKKKMEMGVRMGRKTKIVKTTETEMMMIGWMTNQQPPPLLKNYNVHTTSWNHFLFVV